MNKCLLWNLETAIGWRSKKKISDKKLLVFQQQGEKKAKKCCSRSLHFFFPETHQTKHEPSPSASLFGRNKNRFVFSSQKSSAHIFYITTTVESFVDIYYLQLFYISNTLGQKCIIFFFYIYNAKSIRFFSNNSIK